MSGQRLAWPPLDSPTISALRPRMIERQVRHEFDLPASRDRPPTQPTKTEILRILFFTPQTKMPFQEQRGNTSLALANEGRQMAKNCEKNSDSCNINREE